MKELHDYHSSVSALCAAFRLEYLTGLVNDFTDSIWINLEGSVGWGYESMDSDIEDCEYSADFMRESKEILSICEKYVGIVARDCCGNVNFYIFDASKRLV